MGWIAQENTLGLLNGTPGSVRGAWVFKVGSACIYTHRVPQPHSPFTLYCWKLLLEGVLVLWIEAAEAQELAGAVLRPEAQLLPVLHKAVWVVPAVNHA